MEADMTDEDWHQVEPDEEYFLVSTKNRNRKTQGNKSPQFGQNLGFISLCFILYLQSGRIQESLPNTDVEHLNLPKDRKIKVYADYDVINKNLNHSRFEIVDNMQEADILWLMSHFKDFR